MKKKSDESSSESEGTKQRRYQETIARQKQQIKDLEGQILSIQSEKKVSVGDYEALERRLRNEQDDHLQVMRLYRDLESQLTASKQTNMELINKMKRLQDEARQGVKGIEGKDLLIANLQKKVTDLEALHCKNQQDDITFISERKKLTDNTKRLEAHIRDVDRALIEMMERNKEMAKAMHDSEEKCSRLEAELDYEKKISQRYEQELDRIRLNDRRSTSREQLSSRLGASSDADTQQKLILANNTIAELKAKIESLEKIEQKAAMLQISLNQRNKQLENLQEQYDQSEMEMESYRSSAEEFRLQIEDYRERLDETERNAQEQITTMKTEVKFYQQRTENAFAENVQLQNEKSQMKNEIEELTDRINKYETDHYGLAQAVSEMRQLKTMVSVRDAQIADMILENEWYQNVIAELEGQLPPGFDIQSFYEKVEKAIVEREQKRAEKQALELLKRTLAEHKNAPIGEIKIVLGSQHGKKKTIVVANDANGEMQLVPSHQGKSRKSALSHLPPTKQKVEIHSIVDDSYSFDEYSDYEEEDDEEDVLASTTKLSKTGPMMKSLNTMSGTDMLPMPMVIPMNQGPRVQYAHISLQTEGKYILSTDDEKMPDANPDEDPWVRELRKKYEALKRDKADLEARIQDLRSNNDDKYSEINRLKVRIEELQNENDDLKIDLKSSVKKPPMSIPPFSLNNMSSDSSSDGSSNRRVSDTSQVQVKYVDRPAKNDPLKADVKDNGIQCLLSRIPLSITHKSIYNERSFPVQLHFYSDVSSTVQLPSEEEREIFNAKNNEISHQLESTTKEATEYLHSIEDLRHQLEQRDDLIQEMQKSISRLEKALTDQRQDFHERLIESKNEAERNFESRLKQAREMDELTRNLQHVPSNRSEDLEKYAMRLKDLNESKSNLEEQLGEARETLRFLQKHNDDLLDRLKRVEEERNSLQEKANVGSRQKQITDYSSGLKIKYTKLKQDYDALKDNFEKLKRSRAGRNDPLALSSTSRSDNAVDDLSSSARSERGEGSSKMKSVLVKMESLKSQNEEMQLRLSKANSTVERLTQLVQRKEEQLTKLQQQNAQYKHLLAKQDANKARSASKK